MAHAGEEMPLGGVGLLGLAARLRDRVLLRLAGGDVADDGDHFALGALVAGSARQRAAAHLDPNEMPTDAGAGPLHVRTHAQLDAALGSLHGRTRKRGQIGRAVADLHAFEQALAEKLVGRGVEQSLRRGRRVQKFAVPPMLGDHVGHLG